MDLPLPPGALWGKLFPRRAPFLAWHPLEDHCADVAAVAEALLAQPLIARRLLTLAGVEAWPHLWRERLCALAFLHDFGKANHRFQSGAGGHITEAAYVAGDRDRRQQAGLDVVEGWAMDGRQLLAIILAHHGEAPDLALDTQAGPLWAANGERDPLAGVRRLVDKARQAWPAAFEAGGPPLPHLLQQAPFWHAFLGLLQLADWLGSDAADDAFPFTTSGAPARLEGSRARAQALMAQLGLDPRDLLQRLPIPLSFAAISPHAPSPLQVEIADLAGPIVVLEAETGSGKTEAALWRFARLFAAGQVDSLYFALPTRVAATTMHARIQAACDRLFGAGRLEVVRALPGDAAAGDAALRLLPDFEAQWTDDPNEGRKRTRWAAERPKRFLAAPVAVGTIDQALLGTVRVKHAQMRSFCLSRALLVVDEVHASDTYMSALLERLLQQHMAAGGQALLLSATLGAAARARLLAPGARRPPTPALEEAIALPYPALSQGGGPATLQPATGRGQHKRVEMKPSATIDQPHEIARMALAAARAGAKVLVIRNLVRDSVATLAAVEELAGDDAALFRVDGIATLHHGRFSFGDRRHLDRAVEAHIGRERADGPLILVGTQTLEQSLDIDADYLICDLAPIDVLLQRIGRLHRHERPRPEGFETARVSVLAPTSFDASLAAASEAGGRPRGGPHGLGGFVYENLLSIVATRDLIGSGAVWEIPADNRRLVEQGTHPEALSALAQHLVKNDARWRAVETNTTGTAFARRAAAAYAMVDWKQAVPHFKVERDEIIGTRLGLADRDIQLPEPLASPFPSAPALARLVIPSHLAAAIAPEAEPTEIASNSAGFTFRLGERQFCYDRMGLRLAQR